jgi:hypothetical protein
LKYRCVASFIKIEVLNCESEILREIDGIFGKSAQLKKALGTCVARAFEMLVYGAYFWFIVICGGKLLGRSSLPRATSKSNAPNINQCLPR